MQPHYFKVKQLRPFILLLLLAFSISLSAQQQFGLGAMGVAFKPIDGNHVKQPTAYGLRGEALFTRLGINRVRPNYFSLSASYFPPANHPVKVGLRSMNYSSGSYVYGTAKQSQFTSSVRLGFEIPQHFNDFLFFNFGFSGGIFTSNVNYTVDYDSTMYQIVGLTNDGSMHEKGRGYTLSIFLTAFYEFEKYYLYFQVEDFAEYGQNMNSAREGILFNAGIYYKLSKEEHQ